jgi:hydrogenase nickel incorporation protein HypA/HybF
MHELKIAEDLTAIVLDTALNNRLSKVTKVNIIFGQMIQIVPDFFEFAFREIVRNSLAESAELNIEIVPVGMRCKNCGSAFIVTENLFRCRTCKSTDLDIIHGKELFIKSIEGE